MAEQTSPAQTPPATKDAPKQGTSKTPTTQREVLEQERMAHPVLAVAAHLPTNIDEPFAKAEPKKEPTAAEKETAKEKADLQKKVGEALAKHGGNESNVPSSDPYWSDIARLRSLS